MPNYAKVNYADVYPGVDLVYYGNQEQLEYDFVVQTGADPHHIVLDVGAGLAPPERAPQGAPLHVDGKGISWWAPTAARSSYTNPSSTNQRRTTNQELRTRNLSRGK